MYDPDNDYMKARAQQQAVLVMMEGMDYREGADVWLTWFERGPRQWREWVAKRGLVPCRGKLCTVPTANAQPKSS